MSYQQSAQPNLSTVGRLGYCLEYAENVCGAPHLEANAWQAWLGTKFKHIDSNFPPDVICVQWYDYWLGGAQLGHVTINVPGKGIYSSPWKSGTDHAVLPSTAEVERIYGVRYVGWSEDISGLQIIKENDMASTSPVDETTTRLTYNLGLLRNANDAEVKASVDSGQTEEALLRGTLSSPEHNQVGVDRDYGVKARSEGWEQKVNDLTAANLKLVDQLQTLKVQPVVDPNSVTVTKDGLWTSFKKFLGL